MNQSIENSAWKNERLCGNCEHFTTTDLENRMYITDRTGYCLKRKVKVMCLHSLLCDKRILKEYCIPEYEESDG